MKKILVSFLILIVFASSAVATSPYNITSDMTGAQFVSQMNANF